MTHPDPEIVRLARTRRGPYLTVLGAPAHQRAGLLALLAFDAELARIPQAVSEPMLGRIRLQWWLDVLPGVTGGRAPSHPVAQALAPLALDLRALRELVEAFNFALDEGPADVAQHLTHAQAHGGALARLQLDVLGVADAETRAVAGLTGAAWTLSETLKSGARVASNADAEALRAQARAWLGQARQGGLAKAQRRAALPVLTLARLAERRLKNPHDPLGVGAVLRVWWCGLSGQF